jgi:hypothetical protein
MWARSGHIGEKEKEKQRKAKATLFLLRVALV